MAVSAWHHRTRDTRLLARLGIGVVLAFAALAMVTDLLRDKPEPTSALDAGGALARPGGDDPAHPVQLLRVLAGESFDGSLEEFTLGFIRLSRRGGAALFASPAPGAAAASSAPSLEDVDSRASLDVALRQLGATDAQRRHFADYLAALDLPAHRLLDSDELRRLRGAMATDVIAAYLAVDLAQAGHPSTALPWAREAAGRFDDDTLRRTAWLLAIRLGDRPALRAMLDDPGARAVLDPLLEHSAVMASGELSRLFVSMWGNWGRAAGWMSLLMALFSGVIWFVLTLNLAQVKPGRAPCYLIPVLLGALSTYLVLVVGAWQDARIGWGQSPDLLETAVFHTAGVALREELAKLLAAAPVLLWLARTRHGDDITALVAAGCVGLGFAIEENLGYFGSVPDGNVIARFLTANFLHIATAALSGLALYHVFRQGWKRWDGLLGALLLVIAIHGGYNTALSATDFQDGSLMIISIILLGVLAWRFFDTAAPLMPGGRRLVSPLAIFVVGLALLIGVTYNAFLWNQGFWSETPVFGLAAVHFAPIAFLFIHHYRDA